MSITFFTFPVYAEDYDSSFFLFDLLLPVSCTDQVILDIVQFLINLRSYLIESTNVDISLANFLNNQSFSCFNFIHLGETPEIPRVTSGITHIKMKEYRFPLGTFAEEKLKIAICLMKSYL